MDKGEAEPIPKQKKGICQITFYPIQDREIAKYLVPDQLLIHQTSFIPLQD